MSDDGPQHGSSSKPVVKIIEPDSASSSLESLSQADDQLRDLTENKDDEKHTEDDDQVRPLRSRHWIRRPSVWHRSRSKQSQDGSEVPADDRDGEDNKPKESAFTKEAAHLARTFTTQNFTGNYEPQEMYSSSALSTVHQPTNNRSSEKQDDNTSKVDRYLPDIDYIPTPKEYKPSVFGALLSSKLSALEKQSSSNQKFYKQDAPSRTSLAGHQSARHSRLRSDDKGHASGTATPKRTSWFDKPEHSALASMLVDSATSVQRSGSTTPKKIKWYDKPEHSALASMLVHSALPMAGPGLPDTSRAIPQTPRSRAPSRGPSRRTSLDRPASFVDLEKALMSGRTKSRRNSVESQETLINELRDILACRKYLIKLCGAFMRYGAPSHRLEEHLRASARSLAIDAEFLYIPGAMICTFIDNAMGANSVEVVRQNAGLDFGRLKDVFTVYKCVIHSKYTAEAGIEEIDKIVDRRDQHTDFFRIMMFGLASVVVGPFSFNTRPIDFPPIFVLGCCLGFAQVKIVPRSDQFSNVFEVFACVVIAFASRGLGSIKWTNSDDYVFCFSGLAQSSIAMILPGFMVLNSALELQSRNVVSGSVRMVYSIIYVLFLAFGLLIGTTIFGLMDRRAVNEVSCKVPTWWTPGVTYKLLYTRFIWAPLFACTVAKIYKAKWRQLPVMALIATAGHQANFWISTRLSSNLQVANAIGAFVIGCIANLYSRMFHGLAAAAMLPAIYCQVPGGLAASGSLVAGVNSSDQIFGNSSSISIINNGTAGFVQAQEDPNSVYGGTIFNIGYGMVQVAIGISVGLYLSALVVYPLGKRRSGLFSF